MSNGNSGDKVDENEVSDEMIAVSEFPYHVIAGCFSVKSNADGLVNELENKGYKAEIVDRQGGLYRVSAGGHNNRGAAKLAQEKLQAEGISCWVLKK